MTVKLGHFVYENAGSGCLISKYCNQGLPGPLSESACQIRKDAMFPNDPFCGEFCSTWIENVHNAQTESARLIITRKLDANGNPHEDLYTFDWRDLADSTKQQFYGEAMRYKDILVGAYG